MLNLNVMCWIRTEKYELYNKVFDHTIIINSFQFSTFAIPTTYQHLFYIDIQSLRK